MKEFPNGSINVMSAWLYHPREANKVFARAGVSPEEWAWDDGRASRRAVDHVSSGYTSPSFPRIRKDLRNAMWALTGHSYSLGYVGQIMHTPEFEEVVIQKYGHWRSQVESIEAFARDIWYPRRQAGIEARTGRGLSRYTDVSSGDLL